jgi:hypothetical protein
VRDSGERIDRASPSGTIGHERGCLPSVAVFHRQYGDATNPWRAVREACRCGGRIAGAIRGSPRRIK